MTKKEMEATREAMLFQAEMYLEIYSYFREKVRIDEIARRLASDFFKAQYEGTQRGNRPDPMNFFFSK